MPRYNETEADTIAKRIRPKLEEAGWDKTLIRAETLCPGHILSGGKRAPAVRCDLVLEYKGYKLATIEAKKADVSASEGISQTKDYAQRLGTRYAYASNGIDWYAIDMVTGQEGAMDLPFPSPDTLWKGTFSDDKPLREDFGRVTFEEASGKWQPRYYQYRAITAALEAISQRKKRILLTLATGTGKTAIAFQIAWKLYQARWNNAKAATRQPRILFLTDRNILADQALNSFSAFPSDAVIRIDPDAIKRSGKPPTNASVFFTIFQTFMTGAAELVYKHYPPDFFDFVIIDECHRGGANDEGRWRAVMEHFSPAVQLGLTATPKRDVNADTYAYFGEPVYSYSLSQGIADGYLTPFKVRQMSSTIDEYVYTEDDHVQQGVVKDGDSFEESDFNNRIIISQREHSRVREFMKEMDQNEKTLVFCATQEHAALVRDLINQEKQSRSVDYCHRVTADDGTRGEQHLRNFQDNSRLIPTVLTTSHKLSTGVDARNIRNIVLMRPIKSMIEFKQIIGRGTRLYDGKDHFTIWDFVKAYENFNDPAWDGEPVEPPIIGDPPPDKDRNATKSGALPPGNNGANEPPEKIIVKLADGKERTIQYSKGLIYLNREGKPVSAQEFLEMFYGEFSNLIANEEQWRVLWSKPKTREHFKDTLAASGYSTEVLQELARLVDAPDSDLFDVLGYIAFTTPPLTRKARAAAVNASHFESITDEMWQFLQEILNAYVQHGEKTLSDKMLRQHLTVSYGTVSEGAEALGGTRKVRNGYLAMQQRLYTHPI